MTDFSCTNDPNNKSPRLNPAHILSPRSQKESFDKEQMQGMFVKHGRNAAAGACCTSRSVETHQQ
jgi:hypothetical protein